ncbi:MAG: acyl-CoA/acyl-ACP dehydrogenase [Gammaproteobacteria bacterium]|nr:acyl-CoA/acyl-ACP dehydrogenase [Gammaproteobacteria bacterium]
MLKADPIIVDTVSRICADLCSPERVNAAEDGTWPTELWDALQDTGLSLAWVPESAGGPGATLADGFAVTRTTARSAAPIPVAETLLAGWLLGDAGLRAPPGPMTVAPIRPEECIRCDADGVLQGSASSVPFAAQAEHLVVIALRGDTRTVALVQASACKPTAGTNLAGEAQGSVSFDATHCVSTGPADMTDPLAGLQRMGAAVRSQQMAGALERILELSLEYARERVQFGRPIARFQAIQHNLAALAGEVAAAGAAADAAASAIIRHGIDDPRTVLAVAAAKIRAGEAAGAGAAIAHQVHGAMGFTREYSLHHSTRRLWAWRDDFGPESIWAMRLGEITIGAGARALWPALTAL